MRSRLALSSEVSTHAPPDDTRPLLLIVLGACGLLAGALIYNGLSETAVLFPDFFGLWAFGRFLHAHDPSTIYQTSRLYAFEAALGLPVGTSAYTFFYPPWALLIFAPLGSLPYLAARVLWLSVTFSAYFLAVRAWSWPRTLICILILAPSSVICCIVGQNGFLSAALLLGGLSLLQTRPLLAGGLLAILAYKPNLFFLIPLALIFGSHWRALFGAVCGLVALTLVTTVFIGGGNIWVAWYNYMVGQAASLSNGRPTLLDKMPTLTASVLLAGGSVTEAHLVQLAGVALAIAGIWKVRHRADRESLLAIVLATILATPYAFHYDLPAVTGAVLAVIAAQKTNSQNFRTFEIPLLLGCILLPILQINILSRYVAVATPCVFVCAFCMMAFRCPRDLKQIN